MNEKSKNSEIRTLQMLNSFDKVHRFDIVKLSTKYNVSKSVIYEAKNVGLMRLDGEYYIPTKAKFTPADYQKIKMHRSKVNKIYSERRKNGEYNSRRVNKITAKKTISILWGLIKFNY